MSNPLIVGVDVHRKTNTFRLMDANGQEVRPSFSAACFVNVQLKQLHFNRFLSEWMVEPGE